MPDSYALLSAGLPSLVPLDELGEVEAALYAGSPMQAEAVYPIFVDGRWAGVASVGLGLTVARSLARLMDGDLVYRRAGAYNVFSLTLPAAPAPCGPP